MATFKKILYPIDFDDNTYGALAVAIDLARQNQAKLYLLHVVIPVDPLMISAPVAFERMQKQAADDLANVEAKRLKDLPHETMLRIGHPAHEILAAEKETSAELIVMATHGRTGVSHLLMGSVAEGVVREASCPVLTIHAKGPAKIAA